MSKPEATQADLDEQTRQARIYQVQMRAACAASCTATARPWSLGINLNPSDKSHQCVSVGERTDGLAFCDINHDDEQADVDTMFMLRAVNAHDAMLAALETVPALVGLDDDQRQPLADWWKYQGHPAIALAKGETDGNG